MSFSTSPTRLAMASRSAALSKPKSRTARMTPRSSVLRAMPVAVLPLRATSPSTRSLATTACTPRSRVTSTRHDRRRVFSTDDTGYCAALGAAVVVDICSRSPATSKHGWYELHARWSHGEAAVTDTVTINLDSQYVSPAATWDISAGVDVDVTETLTASLEVGTDESANHYAMAGLTWEPVADTSFSAEGTAYAGGSWTATLSGSREFD